ncbi:malto-oligosyltrehalose synthase [Sphingomonas trueperi]|uniref:malto-oligosyltrehalose synthase n=1 Tax=Sphingomonas trueperi TaxID=53317 RepID=UPI000EB4F53B
MIPRATYRLQFHKDFPFAAAEPLAPYLRDLGISHVYASPIAAARAGSTHGYDGIDPARINPELGGEEGFRRLAATLKAHGIGIVVDIVPNHLAVGGADNRWWLSVLERGAASPFARYFDIDWTSADVALRGKLLAPFLGVPLDEALRSGAIRLVRDAEGMALVAHDTHRFPIRPEDREALAELDDHTLARQFDAATPEGYTQLAKLHARQHYRLAWWRTAADRINWRRFFDITELAGLRVEDPEVFDAVHALPLRLYAEGLIDGVRVDHVDGLADPPGYGRRLRAALEEAGRHRPADANPGPPWLIVEKILGAGERLPVDWATDGTSGYDFMDQVSALQHAPAGAAPLTAHWQALSGRPGEFEAEETLARDQILDWAFPGQLEAAAGAFERLATLEGDHCDVTAGMLRRGIGTLLRAMRVYRSYGSAALADSPALRAARAVAQASAAPGEAFVLDLLCDWIEGRRSPYHSLRREAVQRFEQLSAPLSAKAVEDTAFYRYARLLSRTDVGFSADTFSLSPADFAARVAIRSGDHLHAMLTTATHDHKRGEDVRARLAVLSELPEAWIAASERWMDMPPGETLLPGDRYAILQTVVGAWPLDLDANEPAGLQAFAVRVIDWSRKAMREAKLRSFWAQPDEAYEAAGAEFIRALLAPGSDAAQDLAAFVRRIAPGGAVNAVAQAVLRSTLPGVPDLYQGCDLWDWSLVDPDNRRPVDYAARMPMARLGEGTPGWPDGRLKQAAIAEALHLRRADPALFAAGDFALLETAGARAGHLFAFARRHEGRTLLVAVPLHCATAVDADLRIDPDWWGDTAILAPDGARIPAHDAFAERPFLLRQG